MFAVNFWSTARRKHREGKYTNMKQIEPAKWEKEVLARHRWGRYGDKANQEHARLKQLYEKAQPLDGPCQAIIDQITALEICNWRLEDSILALCVAIGAKKPAHMKIGHMASMTNERWKKIWAYYLSCLEWLSDSMDSGYEVMLAVCDPDKNIQEHIFSLLSEKTKLKELYVQRFCLYLGFMINRSFEVGSAPAFVHDVSLSAVETEIKKHDSEASILAGFVFDTKYKTYAGLELCHHKLFRRLDIILSSIGAGTWRGAMPLKGRDGFERAELLEKYLYALETWIRTGLQPASQAGDDFVHSIHILLAERDDTKVFLASLFVSLLRSQQLYARELAQR